MAIVLIATDDAAVATSMEAVITAQGHRVVWVQDGPDALEAALGESPDFLFVDATLPVYDGFEVCRQLREDPLIPDSLPIFILSSVEENPRELERCGATGCMSKNTFGFELADMLVKYLPPSSYTE